MNDNALPFLRPRSSRATATVDPRTAAFRAMSHSRTSEKALKAHDESLLRSNRGHLCLTANSADHCSIPKSTVPKPPSHAPRPMSVQQQLQATHGLQQQRDDGAHLWWPKYFDGVAFNSHLERLIACKEGTARKPHDAKHAFEALQLVADTLRGTPAAEVLDQVRRILEPLVYVPGVTSELVPSPNDHHQKKSSSSASSTFLLHDCVFGLELELDQLRSELETTKRAHKELRDSTSRQVHEANSRRISTDIGPAMNSAEVAEATIARVQRESAEMATRLQQSLAQQQIVRAKLVDLGMRNMELRQVLEAQRRAATARSWEDVLPKASAGSNIAVSEQQGASLDRAALHILGDVVGSSQTELANLVEYRQRLSNVVYDPDF